MVFFNRSQPFGSQPQLDGSLHDVRLGGLGAQLLGRLLRHVAEADQQGIQGPGHLETESLGLALPVALVI